MGKNKINFLLLKFQTEPYNCIHCIFLLANCIGIQYFNISSPRQKALTCTHNRGKTPSTYRLSPFLCKLKSETDLFPPDPEKLVKLLIVFCLGVDFCAVSTLCLLSYL